MENKVKDVMELFGDFDCSQAILSAWCEDFGLRTETAMKLSCGLAAGMARLGHTCGAVSGAYLVIGLIHGKCHPDDNESKEKTFALIQEFDKQFVELHGSTDCIELLGIDMRYGDKELASRRVRERCHIFVRDAAEILGSLVKEDGAPNIQKNGNLLLE